MGDTFALGDLFCGAGGMSLGAVAAMYKHRSCYIRWGVDEDSDSLITFRKNFQLQRHQAIHKDVHELDPNELKPIDGMLIGLPHTDFARIGKKKGLKGHTGKLYVKAAAALKAKRPLFFIMETTARYFQEKRDEYEKFKAGFTSAGFDLHVKKYAYQDYGLPQKRARMIFIGFRSDLMINDFYHPAPTTDEASDRVTVREALEGIDKHTLNHEVPPTARRVAERLKHIKPGRNLMNSDMPKKLKLNTEDGRLNNLYRRVDPDKIAPMVSIASGGGTGLYHWKFPRVLSVRECARLQSFPDDFEFLSADTGNGTLMTRRKLRQVGQATPPECFKMIMEAVLERLVEQGIRPKRFWKSMKPGTGISQDAFESVK